MLPISSDQIDQLMLALSQAQQDITPALKDSCNPFFKSKYADLSSISNACRLPLSKAGLAVTQTMGTTETGGILLITTLGHSSGQWIRSYLPIAMEGKATPQALGSAITYMRRYALAAIANIVTDDDDGEASMVRTNPTKHFSIPPKPNVISRDQAVALEEVLKACSASYQEQVASYLSRVKTPLNSLPCEVYERLLEKALAESVSHSKNLQKQEVAV